MVATLTEVVSEPSDVPDASIQVPGAASEVISGEPGTVFINDGNSTRSVFYSLMSFSPKDSSKFYLYEEQTEGTGKSES